MEQSKHSPTPWKARTYRNESKGIWIDCWAFADHGKGRCLGGTIGEIYDAPSAEADAAYIVRAVNAHAALVEALRKAAERIEAATGVLRAIPRPSASEFAGAYALSASIHDTAVMLAAYAREARAALALAGEG